MLLLQDNQMIGNFLEETGIDARVVGSKLPVTLQDLHFFVERVRTLERQPLHRCSDGERSDLLRWLAATDVMCLTPNSKMLSHLLAGGGKYGFLMAHQLILSTAAHQIESVIRDLPRAGRIEAGSLDRMEFNRSSSRRVLDRAGLVGVLKVYRYLRKWDAECRWSMLDDLLGRTVERACHTARRRALRVA